VSTDHLTPDSFPSHGRCQSHRILLHRRVSNATADGSRLRCRKTVAPLAIALDLTIDERFDRWDVKGVANAATSYRGPGDVLICWEHNLIRDIVEALSGQDGDGERDELPCYPGNRYVVVFFRFGEIARGWVL
jgi:hypothetical protein